MRTISEGGGGGILGEELRWKEGWKVAAAKLGRRQVAMGVGPLRAGSIAHKSGWVKPGDSAPQNPLCTGVETREFAGRERQYCERFHALEYSAIPCHSDIHSCASFPGVCCGLQPPVSEGPSLARAQKHPKRRKYIFLSGSLPASGSMA